MTAAVNDWLAALQFLRPLWLLALSGLPVLWWLWRLRARRASPWHGVVDPELQAHVLEASGRGIAWLPWRWSLVYVLAVLALAGPAWRAMPQQAWEPRDALVVVLDLSSASRAADLEPDRATRARLKLARLLERRPGGQLGLVVFAASPHTVSPLTTDARTLRRLVDALEPALMPVDGHRPALAIAHARQLLENAGHSGGRIVLLTDRADVDAVSVAASAHSAGHQVSVLGLGSQAGAPVRDVAGGFERDAGGNLRLARLDAASLARLAAAGGGRYTEITADDSDLERLGLLDIGPLSGVGGASGPQRLHDEGIWLVLLMLPLVLSGFRRGGTMAAALLVVCLPLPDAAAMDAEALWKRDDRRAYEALVEGDAERALALARDSALRGAAAYRLGDYAAAADAFAQGADARAHYNRGNALARAGLHEDALAAWHEALRLEPAHADAQANVEALEAWLREQPAQPGDDGVGNENASAGDEADAEDGTQPGDDGTAAERQEHDPDAAAEATGDDASEGADESTGPTGADDPEAQRAADEALREAIREALAEAEPEEDVASGAALDEAALAEQEEADAIERWLGLVDDDPGALLRRKFMIEHQRRQRGEGTR